MHLFSSAMTLKIVKKFDGKRTILRLSGRIQSTNVEEIREQMKGGHAETIVLDLEEVTLVDVDVVRFLGVREVEGVELVNCSPYIRDWIFRERNTEEQD
jgi:anti-anti-sigma regulatory factor